MILENDTKRIIEELPGALSCLAFSLNFFSFLVTNDKSILHHVNNQKRKLKSVL